MKARHLAIVLAVLLLGTGRVDANAKAVFTSANDSASRSVVADHIISVMGKAKRSIHIAVAHYDSQKLVDALVKIHTEHNTNADPADDIEIEVMLDLGEYGDSKSKSRQLESAGIAVRYKTYSIAFFQPRCQLMHHKFMLVDGEELVTGSYNWSDTAEHKNYENIIHYWGRNVKNIVGDFAGEFDKLWDLHRDRYAPFMKALSAAPGDDAYRPVIPVHFDTPYFDTPMALTRAEVAAMRHEFAATGFYGSGSVGRSFYDREAHASSSDAPAGTFIPAAGAAPAPATAGSHGVTGALDGGAGD